MIGVIFQLGGEVIETRIEGTQVYFRSSTYGTNFVPFDNLYLSKEGVLQEFPDLEGDEFWKMKAVQRFKEEMKRLGNEEKICKYLIDDLRKYGYVAKYKQKSGFRPEVLDGN